MSEERRKVFAEIEARYEKENQNAQTHYTDGHTRVDSSILSEMLRFRIAKCDLEKVKWLAKQDHRSVSQWLRNVVRVELERIEPVQNSFWVGSPNTTSSGVEFVSKGEK